MNAAATAPGCAIELERGTPTIVRVEGELDLTTSPSLDAALQAIAGDIAVDLAAVSFIDSSALGVLAITCRRVREAGFAFGVVAASDAVTRILTLTGLGEVFRWPRRARADSSR